MIMEHGMVHESKKRDKNQRNILKSLKHKTFYLFF